MALSEADFQKALAVVLQHEGGYVNNPKDPGGATNFGITQKTYDAWRDSFNGGRQDVRNIERSEVETIYRTDYWRASKANTLPYPLALVEFDTAVNMGVGAALSLLAASGGNVAKYLDLRRARYESIVAARPDSAQFLHGWMKRVDQLASQAAAAVTGGGTTGSIAVLAVVVLGALYWVWRRSTA